MNRSPLKRSVFLVLAGLVAVDVIILVADWLREGVVHPLTLGTAVAVFVLCALVWSGLSWGRWLLLGFILLRGIQLGIAVISSFSPGEALRLGALIVLLFYIGSAVILSLSIARSGKRIIN
jgi:hypothetical protein